LVVRPVNQDIQPATGNYK